MGQAPSPNTVEGESKNASERELKRAKPSYIHLPLPQRGRGYRGVQPGHIGNR